MWMDPVWASFGKVTVGHPTSLNITLSNPTGSSETFTVSVTKFTPYTFDGEEPIIRVVAKGLTEREALLVETTLIWKLGRDLTNLVDISRVTSVQRTQCISSCQSSISLTENQPKFDA